MSGTSAHQQIAAAEALNGPQDAVDEMVEEFRARRDLIVDGLNAIPGVSCLRPAGRVLRLPGHLRHGPDRSRARATGCSTTPGVSVLSGTAFGQVGANHLRISYANSRENISTALERMRDRARARPASDDRPRHDRASAALAKEELPWPTAPASS